LQFSFYGGPINSNFAILVALAARLCWSATSVQAVLSVRPSVTSPYQAKTNAYWITRFPPLGTLIFGTNLHILAHRETTLARASNEIGKVGEKLQIIDKCGKTIEDRHILTVKYY